MKTFRQVYRAMTAEEKRQAAADLKVSPSLFCYWSKGGRQPTLARAFDIEDKLGISVYSWR